jgi:phage shock protein PspC (stress-responsive transcriptional regulator)
VGVCQHASFIDSLFANRSPIGVWVGRSRRAVLQWKESWVHLLVNPAFFGTTPSLVVAYVLAMSVWYPVEQGSDAEEEPRSSAALDSSLNQQSSQGRVRGVVRGSSIEELLPIFK